MLRDHSALVGHHIPAAIGARIGLQHAGESVDFRPAHPRRLGIGLRGAGRIDIAAIRPPEAGLEVLRLDEAVHLLRFRHGKKLRLHAKRPGAGMGEAQQVPLPIGRSQHQPAIMMHADRLAGQRLKLGVKIKGVFLQPRDIGVRIHGRDAPGSVPGGAGGQLGFFEQHHI